MFPDPFADLQQAANILHKPRITLYKIISRDPDEDSDEYTGELLAEDGNEFEVRLDGESFPRTFEKFTAGGVRLWRRA
jgi:hypothetical protein